MENEKKVLRLIHLALFTGVGILIMSLHFVYKPIVWTNVNMKFDMFTIVGLFMAFMCLFMSFYIFKNLSKNLREPFDLNEQNLQQIRQAYIVRWALLEGAALICAIFYFQIVANSFLIYAAFILLFFLYAAKPKFQN